MIHELTKYPCGLKADRLNKAQQEGTEKTYSKECGCSAEEAYELFLSKPITYKT